jgi:type II secretory pathway pseudopilin PulG
MNRRSGATLVEVLVAIFVMGIGLIALLTLFPLGALRMAQAIQDDKCATAAINAGAIARMTNLRNDPLVKTPPWLSGFGSNADLFKDVPNVPKGNSNRVLAPFPEDPSYPVYVDPRGYRLASPTSQYWVGELGGGNYAVNGLIARTPTSFAPPTAPPTAVLKWFSLLDDYVFDSSDTNGGKPYDFGPPSPLIRREIPYSWAYLLQRPRSSDPTMVTCSVVVYNKRPLGLTPTLSLAETAYKAIFNVYQNKNSITVDYNGAAAGPPNVRVGDWILDCTYVPLGTTGNHAYCHGNFYRVVGITDTGTKTFEFEVQQPVRGFPLPTPPTPPKDRYQGGIIVLEGVAEVYEKNLDRKFD